MGVLSQIRKHRRPVSPCLLEGLVRQPALWSCDTRPPGRSSPSRTGARPAPSRMASAPRPCWSPYSHATRPTRPENAVNAPTPDAPSPPHRAVPTRPRPVFVPRDDHKVFRLNVIYMGAQARFGACRWGDLHPPNSSLACGEADREIVVVRQSGSRETS